MIVLATSFFSGSKFLDVPYSLQFYVIYTLPRRPVFFTFSCSYLLYNSHKRPVPPCFGVWYSLEYF
jgi:hypothetical protein